MDEKIKLFQEAVYDYYRKSGRHELPWRRAIDPWGILVSEIMLQQTQIERALEYWFRWLQLWPTPQAQSEAPLEDVLREWSGLGYNRRGRNLWECGRLICAEYGGVVPSTPQELLKLPGIGPYCAGAVSCFAYNHPSVFIETNIRAACISFFFGANPPNAIRDKELVPILEEALDYDNPRVWYWALMDYGAALKKNIPNPNRQSAHYARQSTFKGSFRQRRGLILRTLVQKGAATFETLQQRTGLDAEELAAAADALKKDRLIQQNDGIFSV